MNTYYFETPGKSKGIVFAEYDFEAESLVADYYRIDCSGIELKQIETLEELRECMSNKEVLAFL